MRFKHFFRCHCTLLGVCFSTLLQMNINEICLSKIQPCTVLHPWRITWNIIMEVWKIIFLSKWVIWRFHVNLPGCNFKLGNIFCFVTCFHPMVFSVPFFLDEGTNPWWLNTRRAGQSLHRYIWRPSGWRLPWKKKTMRNHRSRNLGSNFWQL